MISILISARAPSNIEEALAIIRTMLQCSMAISDIKVAFCILPIVQKCYNFVGFKRRDKILCSLTHVLLPQHKSRTLQVSGILMFSAGYCLQYLKLTHEQGMDVGYMTGPCGLLSHLREFKYPQG